MTTTPSGLLEALKKVVRGDVYQDPLMLGIYATDASVYQITPVAVICPKDEADVITALKIAREFKVPILPRGGGTSLAGQTVAEAIVLDFSKYMNTITQVGENTVVVQPGVIRHQLNLFLKNKYLEFAPDPATSTRATVGGMIANNSSGTKSILYGKTSDHVISLKILMADGTILRTEALSPEDFEKKLSQKDAEGNLYRQMMDIALPLQEEVQQRYPKTMRRVGGYALDDFLTAGCRDLNRIIIGSEGTLCIILEATLKLVPVPKYKGVSVVQFDLARDAIRATNTMVQFQPAAVEILSKSILHYSQKNTVSANLCGFLICDEYAIQIVEFYGEDQKEIEQRAEAMHTVLKQKGFGYAHDFYPEGKTYHDAWGIRERGLGLMLGEPTDKKGVPVIEDAAIPLEHLDAFIADVVEICDKQGIETDYYAHASVGVIHIKPVLDLRVQEDIDRFRIIADEVFERVMHYKGSWSSEHGDGIVRSSYLSRFYGEKIMEGFIRIKELFDPEFLLNPGKIVDPPAIDSHLRYGSTYRDHAFPAVYHYREQKDFHTAVHQCSGLGACRKITGGTMCPSFMVTRDEADSTRGRANALRLAMSGQLENGMANQDLPKILDLCLSCKACKTECPSSVDMARLKGEVLQHHYDSYGVTFKDKMIGKSADLARKFSGNLARAINLFQNMSLVLRGLMKSMGMDARRKLPQYASKPLSKSIKELTKETLAPDVILLMDTYTECHEPDAGLSAIRILEALGQKVMVLDAGCCQRPRISHGFLREAAQLIKPGVEKIIPWLKKNIPMLVLEPGCASAWTDDIPDLITEDEKAALLKQIRTFEQYLAELLKEQPTMRAKIRPRTTQVVVHGHCHQKSMFGMEPVRNIFAAWPEVDFYEIDSGCCGMAGSFGYEAHHYDISRKMAERVLIPAIKNRPDALVIANGFSCRHQIADFAGRKAVHLAEAFIPTDDNNTNR